MTIFTAEQNFLLRQAINVWSDLKDAKLLSLPWGEETITDIFIKQLRKNYPGQIDVIPFNKHEEGRNGADWIWSFMNVGKTASITMLVQAKLLDRNEVKYGKLGHIIGNKKTGVRQIDRLIDTADTYSIPALYAFYNYVSNKKRIPNNCNSVNMTDSPYSAGFGISIASAKHVLAAFNNFSFDVQCLHSFPLHCLLCNGWNVYGQGNGDSPTTILRSLRRRISQEKTEDEIQSGGQRAEQLGFMKEMHPLVVRARSNEEQLAAGVDPGEFNLPDVAGIITFTDGEKQVDASTVG
ncbi:DUF6615 family protein [Gluconobacter kondonii]|uniref:DUF6615 family protein n=1 Tax=Gluconobacter kondonii TaxID=941463 RepID=UPI001B8BA593|nr:DUF6615 family protein [Gluconobacter kondonii]MBS1058081.1 hypothetical protein [Gluconobacter kondonii]